MTCVEDLPVLYKRALEECLKGKVSEELKLLYKLPDRHNVDWTLFPPWARPDSIFEGEGHEG